jgi:GT2 family glycosyltransferase
MNISLLMLTYNRRPSVQRCFRSLAHTLERGDVREWLICDNASTDDTPGYLRHFLRDQPKVSCMFSSWNRGVAGGRDYLMRAARGDVLVLLDSDVIVTDCSFLDRLLDALNRPGVGIAGLGAHIIPRGWTWPFEAVPGDYEGPADMVSGFCQAFRRSLLSTCALDLRYNPFFFEDTDFCLQAARQGWTVWSMASDRCGLRHDWGGSGALLGEFQRKYRYFVGKWQGTKVVQFERLST